MKLTELKPTYLISSFGNLTCYHSATSALATKWRRLWMLRRRLIKKLSPKLDAVKLKPVRKKNRARQLKEENPERLSAI